MRRLTARFQANALPPTVALWGGPGAKEVRSKVGVWSMVEDGLEPTK